MKSKTIAISAISATFVALVLTLGSYVQVADVFCIVISSVFVILPSYFKSYWGCFLTYLAGGLIAFMCFGFNINIVFPSYFLFFGIYPIVKCIMIDKGFNRYLGIVIGLIWFVAFAYGLYFYYTLVLGFGFLDLPLWLTENIYYFVAVFAVVFFAVFEAFVVMTRLAINRYLGRIVKK